MNTRKYQAMLVAVFMTVTFAVWMIKPTESFSQETMPVSEGVLENAWKNLNLDEIDFEKAGLSEQKMRETLARVCAAFSADPQKTQFLVKEMHTYDEFRDLYLSSSKSVRKRVDTLLPKVLDNIFMGKESVTWDISVTDQLKGLATYLANKKKMDAFKELRRNETMMRRFSASIYKSMDIEDAAFGQSLETLFVTIANKKKYKIKKTATA